MRTTKPNIYFSFLQSLCMTRWLAISNRTNWEITRKKNIWGVPQRNKSIIERVKPGDTVLIYVSQQKEGDNLLPSAVTGAFEVASEPYKERTKVFVAPEQMGDEVFPYRIKLKPIKVFGNRSGIPVSRSWYEGFSLECLPDGRDYRPSILPHC